jgi:hypothetical protein
VSGAVSDGAGRFSLSLLHPLLQGFRASQGHGLAQEPDDGLVRWVFLPQDEPLAANDGTRDGPHAVAEPAAGPHIDGLGLDPVQTLLQRGTHYGLGLMQAVELLCGGELVLTALPPAAKDLQDMARITSHAPLRSPSSGNSSSLPTSSSGS